MYEQSLYKDNYAEVQYLSERAYRERKEESRRHSERKYDEKKAKDARYPDGKHRREKYDDEKRSSGDKTLQDLRERLLSKRTNKGDEGDVYRSEKGESHREKKYKDNENIDSVLQGEAGMLVKEIISISTNEERRHRREEKYREDDKLTEEEKAEQDIRREKLLEAGIF